MTNKCDNTRIFIKKSIFPSAYKAVKSFLIVSLVTNQSGTNFIATRQSSTALSHIC